MAQELTIGKVAKLAEVNVETIRYYHRRKLLAEPDKPYMVYRRYPADVVSTSASSSVLRLLDLH